MKKRLFIAPLLIFLMVGVLTTFARSADVPRMTKDELKAMLGNPDLVIVDVRFGKDWTDDSSKIKGAIREDPESPKSWAEKYSKDKTIVLYCA
jgi:rhodanese-related sulfurtransferase